MFSSRTKKAQQSKHFPASTRSYITWGTSNSRFPNLGKEKDQKGQN